MEFILVWRRTHCQPSASCRSIPLMFLKSRCQVRDMLPYDLARRIHLSAWGTLPYCEGDGNGDRLEASLQLRSKVYNGELVDRTTERNLDVRGISDPLSQYLVNPRYPFPSKKEGVVSKEIAMPHRWKSETQKVVIKQDDEDKISSFKRLRRWYFER
mgnify:CR=1 FL=1